MPGPLYPRKQRAGMGVASLADSWEQGRVSGPSSSLHGKWVKAKAQICLGLL